VTTPLTRTVRPPLSEGDDLPRIYCFANAETGDWIPCLAIAEDGAPLASHICSRAGWGPHDLGITTDLQHERYLAHYPGGFTLEWVPDPRPGNHAAFDAAMSRNRTLGEAMRAVTGPAPAVLAGPGPVRFQCDVGHCRFDFGHCDTCNNTVE